MKQTFKNHSITIIIFFAFFIPLMYVSLSRVEYTIVSPGFNDKVESFVELNDPYPSEGAFHTTSVMVMDRATILQYYIAEFDVTMSTRETPSYVKETDPSDVRIMSRLQKDEAIQNALVVGAINSGYNITYETDFTVYLIYNYMEEDTLEVGDKIQSVNGSTDFTTAFDDVVCGETAEFIIHRDDEELTFQIEKKEDYDCRFGLVAKDFNTITDANLEYEIYDTNTGGSSGGLIQALFIYNQLMEFDYTLGLQIAGTGTIDIEGNVGSIGGIEQKIITSHVNGMDIFFVPHLSDSEYDNYIRAKAQLELLNSDMILVPVATFQEAIEFLENYEVE